MIMLFRLLAILCLFFNVSSYAVDCYQDQNRGPILIEKAMPPFRIPQNAQPGQKIWESDDISVHVFCNNAGNWSAAAPTETVHAWIKLSEFNDPAVLNNPYLKFGVTYNGQDYEANGQGIDTRACLDRKNETGGQYSTKACEPSTYHKSVEFDARFRLYVKLLAIPTSTDGLNWNFGDVNVLQFDGSQGANTLSSAKNLHANITGLNNISFLDCSVNLRIFPESQIVNFGQISASAIKAAPHKAVFSISTIKDATANCSEQFDVSTNFYTDDTLYDNTHLEMGNGLLMRITDQKTKSDVVYNQYKLFTTYIPGQSATTATREYEAELTQQPGQALTVGPFQRDLIVKINYN